MAVSVDGFPEMESPEGRSIMTGKIYELADYEKYVGAEAVDRIRQKARPLQGLHVVNINSAYYGSGVAEMLSSMSLLMNSVGIKTGWRVIQGAKGSPLSRTAGFLLADWGRQKTLMSFPHPNAPAPDSGKGRSA